MRVNKKGVFIRGHKAFIGIAAILIAAAFDFTLTKHEVAHQQKQRNVHYFTLAEEFKAAKNGDTLYGCMIDSVLDISFGDCPKCEPYIFIGN